MTDKIYMQLKRINMSIITLNPYDQAIFAEGDPEIDLILATMRRPVSQTKSFSSVPDTIRFHFKVFLPNMTSVPLDDRGYIKFWTKKSILDFHHMEVSTDWSDILDWDVGVVSTWLKRCSVAGKILPAPDRNFKAYTQFLTRLDPFRKNVRKRARNIKKQQTGKAFWDGEKMVHKNTTNPIPKKTKPEAKASTSTPATYARKTPRKTEAQTPVSAQLKLYNKLNKGKKLTKKQKSHLEKLNGGPLDEAKAGLTKTILNNFSSLPSWFPTSTVEKCADSAMFVSTLIVNLVNGASVTVSFLNTILQAVIFWKIDIEPFMKVVTDGIMYLQTRYTEFRAHAFVDEATKFFTGMTCDTDIFNVMDNFAAIGGIFITAFLMKLTKQDLNITSLVKSFTTLAAGAIGLSKIIELIKDFIIPPIFEKLTGKTYKEAKFVKKCPRVYLWCSRVIAISKLEEISLQVDPLVQQAILRLDKETKTMSILLAHLCMKGQNQNIKKIFETCSQTIKTLREVVRTHDVRHGITKMFPSSLMLSGTTSIGKTTAIDSLFEFIMNEFHSELPVLPHKYMFKGVESKFWDDYTNDVLVFVLDDYGQMVQNKGTGTWETEGVIYNLFSSQRTLVNKANLEEKGSVHLNPQHVLVTTNEKRIDKKGILRTPESAARRFEFAVEAKLKEPFRSLDKSLDAGHRANMAKIMRLPSYDEWKKLSLSQRRKRAINGAEHRLEAYTYTEFNPVDGKDQKTMEFGNVDTAGTIAYRYAKLYHQYHERYVESQELMLERSICHNPQLIAFHKFYKKWDAVDEGIEREEKSSLTPSFQGDVSAEIDALTKEHNDLMENFMPDEQPILDEWTFEWVTMKEAAFAGSVLAAGLLIPALLSYLYTNRTICFIDDPHSIPDVLEWLDGTVMCTPDCEKCHVYCEDTYGKLKVLQCAKISIPPKRWNSNRTKPQARSNEFNYKVDDRIMRGARPTGSPGNPDEAMVAKGNYFVKTNDPNIGAINRNVYLVIANDVVVGKTLFVDTTHMLWLDHYTKVIGDSTFKLVRFIDEDYSKELVMGDLHIQSLGSPDLVRDVQLARVKVSMTSHKNLISRFVKDEEIKLIGNGLVTMHDSKIIDGVMTCVRTDSQGCPKVDTAKVFTLGDRALSEARAIQAQIVSQKGDCGSILISKHTSIEGKFLGVLHAGGPTQSSFAMVTRGMLEDKIKTTFDVEEPLEALSGLQPGLNEFLLGAPGFHVVGNMEVNHIATKSKLRRSAISKSLNIKNDFSPARLRHVDAITSLMKFGRQKAEVPETSVERIFDQMWPLFAGGNPRVLTHEEALHGLDGLCPINRNTSAGYPLSSLMTGGGKKECIPEKFAKAMPVQYELFMEYVNDMQQKCEDGIVPFILFTIAYKDEPLPRAKILAGKQRIVCTAPVAYTYLFRKYFGAYMVHVSKNNIDNEISLGLSDSVYDITRLKLHLTKHSNGSFGDGDYTAFEAYSSSINGDQTADFINRWYNQMGVNEHENNIRSMLWQASNRPFFLFRGNVIQAPGGNPSGWPGTALKNNLDNCKLFRECFHNLCPGEDFTENVSFIAGGDDHAWCVTRPLADIFKPSSIKVEMAKVGMIWTPAAKGETVIDDFPVEDIVFLGRDIDGILRDSAIEKMLHYVRNDDISNCTKDNIHTALRELSRRPKHEYNIWRDLIIDSCVKCGLTAGDVWDYEHAIVRRCNDEMHSIH